MFYYWVNIDILDLSEHAKSQAYDFLQHDITKGLSFKDNIVDLIFTSHMIEHLDRNQGDFLLRECYRVLKPGGVLRISTPDTQLITNKYLDGTIWEYKYINVGVEQAHDDAEAYYNLLLAGHKTIYDENSLTKLLSKTGFKEIKRCSPFESRSDVIKKQTITLHPSLSLVLEAEKL
jgi:predicted SAM-dependent methyltransferase